MILDFRSSMTAQSYDRASSRSRYGKPILSNKMYRNSVISFPPTFRRILGKDGICRERGGVRDESFDVGQPQHQRNFGPKKWYSHLVSGTTSPSSTQAILVTAAPRFTTQAVDIPAP